MEIKFKTSNKTLIVSVSGEIDHHTSIEIREEIDREIERNPIKNIIFDFENVSFMDSSGVGVIIGRYKNIQKLDGKAAIINLTPQIKRVFEISGLFKIIPFFNTLEDALKSM